MEQVEAADFLLGPNSGSPTSPHLLQPLKGPKGRPVFYSSKLTFFILPPRSEGVVSEGSKDSKFYSLLKSVGTVGLGA